MIKVLVLAGILLFQGYDPGPRPPEAPNDAPHCNNYFKTSHKCTCNKALKCHGDPDGIPDSSVMASWCTQQCHKGKCDCIEPCVTMKNCDHGHKNG